MFESNKNKSRISTKWNRRRRHWVLKQKAIMMLQWDYLVAFSKLKQKIIHSIRNKHMLGFKLIKK